MEGFIKIDLANKQIVWPDENPDFICRYVGGPRGQIELIDLSGWGIGAQSVRIATENSVRSLTFSVLVKISGAAGTCSYTLDAGQVFASPSTFVTAVQNSITPASPTHDVIFDMGPLGLSINKDTEIHAFEVLICYLKYGRVNTARSKTFRAAKTESASGHYDIAFQVRCILLAQQFGATRLVELLVQEVRREWLTFPLRIKHFSLATTVNGALDPFLVEWVEHIEHEKDDALLKARINALCQGLKLVKGLQTLVSREFLNNPNKRFSAVKLIYENSMAAEAQMQANGQTDFMNDVESADQGLTEDANKSLGETVAEGFASSSAAPYTHYEEDIDQSLFGDAYKGVDETIAEAFASSSSAGPRIEDEGDIGQGVVRNFAKNQRGILADGSTNGTAGRLTDNAVSTQTTDAVDDVGKNETVRSTKLKINGPKVRHASQNPAQHQGTETFTTPMQGNLCRSERKRKPVVIFNEGPAQLPRKRNAKINDQGSIAKSTAEKPKTGGEGSVPNTLASKTPARKIKADQTKKKRRK